MIKVKTTRRKISDKDFQTKLRAVMEKWPEAKDILVLVKTAHIIEAEVKTLSETMTNITEKIGFDLDGRKSANSEEIINHLLSEHGKVLPDGNRTIAGASDDDQADFKKKMAKAEKCILAFNKAIKALLDEEIELEIPRLLKVTEKLIRKQVINANDCFVLAPLLDLSEVAEDGDKATEAKKDDDDDDDDKAD